MSSFGLCSPEVNKEKKEFFDYLARNFLGLTYDDVTLKTGYSKTPVPSTETLFSIRTPLKIPLVSAAMDTVTESEMAIAMALNGGIGIIHKNLTPDEQAREVARVKSYLNGLIDNPVCVYPDQTIDDLLRMKEENGYKFHKFPVVDREGRLLGVLTRKDFEYIEDSSRRIGGIMTKEGLVFEEQGCSIEEAYDIMKERRISTLPLVDNNKKLKGMYVFDDLKEIKKGNRDNYNLDDNNRLIFGAAVGVGEDAIERGYMLIKEGVDVLVTDAAHIDTEPGHKIIKDLLKLYGDRVDIVAGNISEPESAEEIAKLGVHGIKVGQGPGRICSTRKVAGVGAPQISAVYRCALVAHRYGIPVCADGGIKYTGDVPKAIAAGAHSVMMGGVFAGTEEAPGEKKEKDGKYYKCYRGMGSLEAMKANRGSRERYMQKDGQPLVAEGVSKDVPFKGPVELILAQYIGALKRSMAYYLGVSNIQELIEKGRFQRITPAGNIESMPFIELSDL